EPAASRPPATPSVGSRINWPTAATVLGMVVVVGIIVLLITQRMNREEPGDSRSQATATNQSRPAPHTAVSPAVSKPATPLTAESPSQQTLSVQVISVKVEATGGQCWVGYQIDDGRHTSMMLEEGQSRSLPDAQDKVILDIGNRKALTVKINNQEVTFPPNTPNFTAHVIISRDNLQNYLQSNGAHSF